ncbi:hypothetical protein GCM10027570_25160 [Streptomonospora sediminis]
MGGRRERLRQQLSEDVRRAARAIISEDGVEALTLAAIARRVEVTPAALYRHFSGLPEIVVEVGNDIAEELYSKLQASVDAQPEHDMAARLVAPCRTLRRWSLRHRQEFHLLFGTPTAAIGDAHTEMTGGWVRGLAAVWGPLFVTLWAKRPFPVAADDDLDPQLRQQIADYRAATGVELPLGALVVFLSCWRSIYGAVALEAFEHFAPLIEDQEPMFEQLMQELLDRLGVADGYRPPGS